MTLFWFGVITRIVKTSKSLQAESSQFLRKRGQRWGGNLFHYGIIMSPDINTLNESTALELKKLVEYTSAWLTELLDKGRQKGIFAFFGEARDKAMAIFSSLVSGLQLSRVVDNFDFKSLYRFIQADLKA